MESAALARNGYSQASRQIKSARSIEYDVFARITARLRRAIEAEDEVFELVAALHENRELWTLLAVDLVDPGNALPQQLKAQLFYLAEFTFQHTTKVLSRQAEAGVLVDINTSIMIGLRGRGAEI